MKVIKSILIAVVLGIVYVGIGLMKIDNIKMSEILLANTMSGVEFIHNTYQHFHLNIFQFLFFKFCSQQIYTNIFVVQAFIFFQEMRIELNGI